MDYFVVSVRGDRIADFVGVELQTLDTTGTVWPERQRLLAELTVRREDNEEASSKPFGMNWKMTAKTILVQMHHKSQVLSELRAFQARRQADSEAGPGLGDQLRHQG